MDCQTSWSERKAGIREWVAGEETHRAERNKEPVTAKFGVANLESCGHCPLQPSLPSHLTQLAGHAFSNSLGANPTLTQVATDLGLLLNQP